GSSGQTRQNGGSDKCPGPHHFHHEILVVANVQCQFLPGQQGGAHSRPARTPVEATTSVERETPANRTERRILYPPPYPEQRTDNATCYLMNLWTTRAICMQMIRTRWPCCGDATG